MDTEKNFTWFKEVIVTKLKKYEIEYKFSEKGDFGSLNRIGFNNEFKGGYVDFWSSGWVNIFLVDYIGGDELLNLLMEPSEKEKINESLEKLVDLL